MRRREWRGHLRGTALLTSPSAQAATSDRARIDSTQPVSGKQASTREVRVSTELENLHLGKFTVRRRPSEELVKGTEVATMQGVNVLYLSN